MSFSFPLQGRQGASSHVFLVLLEPGTDLHLRLGDEVLVLAPQTALQLDLRDVLVVVLPWHVVSSSEELFFPGHARCIVPRDANVTWAIDIEDGSLSARRAGVGEEAEAPRGPSPPSLSTLLLRPLRRAAGTQGGPGLPGPAPRRAPRPVPAEFSLDLHGLRPCPGSALRPLPASPSPGPRPCRAARRRPPTGARRRLF